MTIEQLLNKLIEKGWRPFNKDIKEFFTLNEFTCGYRGEGTNHLGTIRAIVSKESGLRQFVCENGMINVPHPNKGKYPRDKLEREQYKYWDRTIGYYGEDNLDRMGYSWDKYQFRLIESSLKDESGLEDFLLQNIRIEDESNQNT